MFFCFCPHVHTQVMICTSINRSACCDMRGNSHGQNLNSHLAFRQIYCHDCQIAVAVWLIVLVGIFW